MAGIFLLPGNPFNHPHGSHSYYTISRTQKPAEPPCFPIPILSTSLSPAGNRWIAGLDVCVVEKYPPLQMQAGSPCHSTRQATPLKEHFAARNVTRKGTWCISALPITKGIKPN